MSCLFKDPVVILKEIISWLFQDSINSGLPQFDHAQSNSKKWPKGYKDQIAPNEFFSRKTTNKMFMYLLAPFILVNFKKILRPNPELWECAIFRPKMAHLSWTHFFWYKPLLLSLLLSIDHFHCAKSKKILTADPELWGCAIFWPKLVHLPQYVFWKIINITLTYLLAPFIVPNFKIFFSSGSRVIRMWHKKSC